MKYIDIPIKQTNETYKNYKGYYHQFEIPEWNIRIKIPVIRDKKYEKDWISGKLHKEEIIKNWGGVE